MMLSLTSLLHGMVWWTVFIGLGPRLSGLNMSSSSREKKDNNNNAGSRVLISPDATLSCGMR